MRRWAGTRVESRVESWGVRFSKFLLGARLVPTRTARTTQRKWRHSRQLQTLRDAPTGSKTEAVFRRTCRCNCLSRSSCLYRRSWCSNQLDSKRRSIRSKYLPGKCKYYSLHNSQHHSTGCSYISYSRLGTCSWRNLRSNQRDSTGRSIGFGWSCRSSWNNLRKYQLDSTGFSTNLLGRCSCNCQLCTQ